MERSTKSTMSESAQEKSTVSGNEGATSPIEQLAKAVAATLAGGEPVMAEVTAALLEEPLKEPQGVATEADHAPEVAKAKVAKPKKAVVRGT